MATEYNGINYFPIQTTFFEGNTQELLEAKHGIKGPYLMMQLLCKIYKEGYYLHWGEEQSMIFAHKLGSDFSKQEVNEMVNTLLEKGFFDEEKYRTDHVLTSEGIQRVWIEATNRRKRDFTKLPYLLIDTVPAEKPQKSQQKETSRAQDVDIFDAQPALNEENADIFRQSKGKERKGKQRKTKNFPPLSPRRGRRSERRRSLFYLPRRSTP